MKFMKFPIALLLITVLVLPSVCFYPASGSSGSTPANDETFFGVTFGGNTTSEAKLLIDKVKGYTNLFVVDNWDIALNETALNEICQYAVDANLSIMVYFNFIFMTASQLNPSRLDLFTQAGLEPFHIPWLSSAYDRWGEKFLGAYILDEPGGKQIDVGHYSGFTTVYSGRNQTTFANVSDYSDAANRFVRGLDSRYYLGQLINFSYPGSIPNATGRAIPVFTADNALYWFDYLAGYDAVFAELGWNHNEAQHIALCRGAANVQNKQWGAIITWASNDPPYLASGSQMLEELNVAYSSGAKYMIVFNYPQINPYGALTEEHFTAMETFWNQIHSSPRNAAEKVDQVALVLPKDYGWGMRQPDDKIWGLWPADDLSPLVGERIATLINEYGLKLDIIYDDPQFNYTEKYSKIYYWNSSTPIYLSSVPIIIPSNELYATLLIAAIAIICIPSYVITKRKKRRKPEAILAGSASKARKTNFGRGKLELVGNTIRFQTEKGYLRKRKEIAREIPVTDVESIKRVGSEFSVTWKGITDIFVIEETDLVGTINERITETQEKQRRMLQDKEAAKQERNELAKILSVAIEITGSLFDVLRSLHGQVDWNRVESYSKRSEEKWKGLHEQKDWAIDLDFTKLLLAVKAHHPKEASKETYSILRTLYEYFRGLTSKNEFLDEIHPNCHDAKTTILAYYTLNDVILGTIVGDEEIGRESNEIVTMLDELSKRTDLKINVEALKGVINKLGIKKGNEGVIEETRMVFRQQLKAIMPDLGTA
jgi:hypothetical protein